MMEGKKPRIDNNNPDLVVDRISAMPNSILGHILSFLRTKEAVATSILSKRWKLAWVTVHNLDFDFHESQVAWNESENMSFIRFVHRVLLLTDGGPLNKFSLDWRFWILSHVICWIDAAIIRNVRELYMYLSEGELLRLPISGFNCLSLQSLEVNDLTFVHDATAVCLPRLESLKLDRVHFTSKEACEKLISGLPMLHYLNLTIYYEDEDDVDAYDDFMCIISSASLRSLDIYFEDVSKLKLKASSLEYLRLRGDISEIFVEKSLSSLVQADFHITLVKHDFLRLDEHDFLNNSIVEAVRAFEGAKILSLSEDVMQALSRATISLSTEFTRLVKLEAEEAYCSPLQDIIQSSCNLEALKIYQCSSDLHYHPTWTTPVDVPKCLSNSLKEVQYYWYNGLEYEREMISYMLKYGSVLESMWISCNMKKDGEKLKLVQEICEFPRKSPVCKVKFSV